METIMRFHRKLSLGLFALLMAASPALAAPQFRADSDVAKQLNLPIYEWSDPQAPSKGTIVAIHGLTFYATSYDDFARHLAERGYRVYAADMRGFGKWKTESAKYGGDDKIHFTQSKEDIVKLLTLLKKNSDDKIICLGESLGANLAMSLAAEHPDLIDGTIVSALCVKTCVHPRARWAVDFWKGLSHPNKPFNLEPYITPYLSHDPKLTADCLADANICRSMSVVELIKAQKTNQAAIDSLNSIPNSMPILVMAGQEDQVVQAKVLPKMVAHMSNKNTKLNVFPKKGHLLIEHQAVDPNVSRIVDNWLESIQNTSVVSNLTDI